MLYMFQAVPHPSSGAQTVHTASGICQTLLLPAAILVVMELHVCQTAVQMSCILTTLQHTKSNYTKTQAEEEWQ
jgi:hypothetical protein